MRCKDCIQIQLETGEVEAKFLLKSTTETIDLQRKSNLRIEILANIETNRKPGNEPNNSKSTKFEPN